jgi:uncharacterized protein YihD (DUF1040 family)
MKHLKKFESFEENIPVAKFQLEENQVDDLHEQFESFVEDMERSKGESIDHKELQDIFSVDENGEISDDFVKFLDYLAENTDWFDFKMMDAVKNDIAIIVAKMGVSYEDEDDFEWAQDDDEWPYEAPEETGEFAEPQSEEEDEIEQLRQKTFSKEPELNVDEILDKITASGYDSLTDEEKGFLSKQESRRILGFNKFNS